jgi:hypothetical protein
VRFNLILAFVWLAMASVLLVVNGTETPIDGLPPGRQTMTVAVFALVLAAYNFARWGASRAWRNRKPDPPPPPKKRAIDGAGLEYNPELDFTRPDAVGLPGGEKDSLNR